MVLAWEGVLRENRAHTTSICTRSEQEISFHTRARYVTGERLSSPSCPFEFSVQFIVASVFFYSLLLDPHAWQCHLTSLMSDG